MRFVHRLGALAATVGVVMVTTACGGGASSPTVAHIGATTTTTAVTATASGGAPADLYTKALAYSACMHSHGVRNFPEPQAGSSGSVHIAISPSSGINPTSAGFRSAARTCGRLLPVPPTPPTITPADQDNYLEASACMRSHGIAGFPDPDFSEGRVNFPLPSGMNPDSTQFEKARLVCELLIPAGLPYSKQDPNGG